MAAAAVVVVLERAAAMAWPAAAVPVRMPKERSQAWRRLRVLPVRSVREVLAAQIRVATVATVVIHRLGRLLASRPAAGRGRKESIATLLALAAAVPAAL